MCYPGVWSRVEEGTARCNPAAARWAATWDQDQAARRRAAIHPLLAGASTRPAGLSQFLRTGRALSKPRTSGRGVRGPDGVVRTDRAAMNALLWSDREDLWTQEVGPVSERAAARGSSRGSL